jgi:transcriptional regulator with XRE-family HTH domain
MENTASDSPAIDFLIAQRLKALRTERGWSLDSLAKRSQISRATLSRLENAEVSATANVLGKLCAAYGLTMSRLMRMIEEAHVPMVRRDEQTVWIDPDTGYERRSVSPPSQSLAGEVLHCELPPHTRIDYDDTPRLFLEHHLVLLEGQLEIIVEGLHHQLQPGDCLRYQLCGPSSFITRDSEAKYFLFIV